MASIKERAKEFAEREYIHDQYEKERIAFGYYHGATDQRKRDIEKVCYFIKGNTTLDRWVNVDAIAEQLRKAMEDEQ